MSVNERGQRGSAEKTHCQARTGTIGGMVCWALLPLLLIGGCARRVPPSVVSAPHYPEFVFPEVPSDLAGPASSQHDAGWRWLQAGELAQAEREFTAALKRAPGFFPAEAGLAYVDLARDQFEQSAARFERILQQHNDYDSALVGRGEALMALKREPEALSSFEAALRADPALSGVRERVEVLRLRVAQQTLAVARKAADAGRFDEAVRAYDQAIAASPDSAFLYRDLAAVERESGRTDQALEHLKKAVELDPADAASLARIGEILESRNELDAALAAYERAEAVASDEAVRTRIAGVLSKLESARLPPEYLTIRQSSAVTRGELAALIGVRLDSLLRSVPGQAAVVVTDTRGHWASGWIMSVARAGIIDPYPNHAFEPNAVVRRGELAQAVNRVLGVIAREQPARLRSWRDARPEIADVSAANLSYADAAAAVASGVLPLLEGGRFDLARPVSGAEAIGAVSRLEALAR
jgi:tetratricopeptide (TPR) repeat protein